MRTKYKIVFTLKLIYVQLSFCIYFSLSYESILINLLKESLFIKLNQIDIFFFNF